MKSLVAILRAVEERGRGQISQGMSCAATKMAGIVAVAAAVALAGCGSSQTTGLTPTPPSSAQLSTMASFYVRHDGIASYGSNTHLGCVVTPMAIRRGSGGRTRSYSQTFCQAYPITNGRSGIYPTVYMLKGDEVVSVQQADAPGDPTWFNQIKRLFPRNLWTDAAGHTARIESWD